MKEKLFCVICEKELQGNQKMYCCNNCKAKAHYNKQKDKSTITGNTAFSQERRGISRKLELIEIKGGGCSQCGYNKNIAALEFHHVNASEKELKLDKRTLSNVSMDKILEELNKCILLCSNCHKELHYPESEFNITKKILSLIKIHNPEVIGSFPVSPTKNTS